MRYNTIRSKGKARAGRQACLGMPFLCHDADGLAARYRRNLGALTSKECRLLHAKHVCVVGCGGLGGYVVEALARLGVGTLTVIDGDRFDETNLNRQLLCTEENLGQCKALAAKARVEHINRCVYVHAHDAFLSEENARSLLGGCDVAVDALDSLSARRVLFAACTELAIPLVHGAVNGWCAQAAVFPPASAAFDRLYPQMMHAHSPFGGGCLSFVPMFVASVEAAETVKLLLNQESALTNRLLSIDFMQQRYHIIDLT